MRDLPAVITVVLLTSFLGACGDGAGEAEPGQPAQPQAAAAPVMGSVQTGETTYPFRVNRCDMTGTAPGGILARGYGTLPDDRRLGVEVERLTPEIGGPGWLYERVTVQFGGFMEEDGWEATAMSTDGSRWTDGNGAQVLEGPIIAVSGHDLVVAATYKHASRDERVAGTLRVTCPAEKYP